jgi:hypothetical protein
MIAGHLLNFAAAEPVTAAVADMADVEALLVRHKLGDDEGRPHAGVVRVGVRFAEDGVVRFGDGGREAGGAARELAVEGGVGDFARFQATVTQAGSSAARSAATASSKRRRTTSTARLLARAPPLWPPMPSATT